MHRGHSLSVALALTCSVMGACQQATHLPAAGSTPSPHAHAEVSDPPGMAQIPAGTFRMGTLDGPSHETPVHEVEIRSFFMDRTEVTVGNFAEFVKVTGHTTEAESIGWSGVFDPQQQHRWVPVKGAAWRHPDGPDRPPAAANEPVTQVSWNDAQAYAHWIGKRLPTEAEWEYAARGGVDQAPYVWGHVLRPRGHPVANWWQGSFPAEDTGEDGFEGRAPVGRFEPNAFDLVDMIGNVWEWCADWYGERYYAQSPRRSPSGPATGLERVMRGCGGSLPGTLPTHGVENAPLAIEEDAPVRRPVAPASAGRIVVTLHVGGSITATMAWRPNRS